MIFWGVFYGIIICLTSIMFVLDVTYKKRVMLLIVCGTILVSGFRHDIGADFHTYQSMYEIFANGDIDTNVMIEPSFIWISYVLGTLGFNFQMIFLFYAIVSIYGIYYGLKEYFGDLYIGIGIAFLLFLAYNSPGGFWWSMNAIRQAAALGIVFAGSSFLYSNRIKHFLLSVSVACFFHYSAVLAVFMVVFARHQFRRKYVFAIVAMSFVASYAGLSQNMIISIMASMAEMTGKYVPAFWLLDTEGGNFTASSYLYLLMYLFAFFILSRYSEKIQIVFNFSTVYIVIRILTSFSLEGSVIHHLLHRFEVYYLPFFFIYISKGLLCFVQKCKPSRIGQWIVILFLSLFTFITLENIAATGGEDTVFIKSKGTENVTYDYNIDLF